tara:strand:+ start:394 stop:657 length:264 start_codon:yes stop_codon:yes gene_type:complete
MINFRGMKHSAPSEVANEIFESMKEELDNTVQLFNSDLPNLARVSSVYSVVVVQKAILEGWDIDEVCPETAEQWWFWENVKEILKTL